MRQNHIIKKLFKKSLNADAYNNLAWLYYVKKEHLDEAENLAAKAVELNPSKKNIYLNTLKKIRELKKPININMISLSNYSNYL